MGGSFRYVRSGRLMGHREGGAPTGECPGDHHMFPNPLFQVCYRCRWKGIVAKAVVRELLRNEKNDQTNKDKQAYTF